MSELRPDVDTIRATYRWLAHAPHGVSEVRVIRPGRGILGIGFFDDEDAFLKECVRSNAGANIFVGIQPRPSRLLELAPNVIRPRKSGGGSKDIEIVTATCIDLDPARPKDTASTQTELDLAIQAAEMASNWLEEQGFARPCRMMSGNGAQLWLAVPAIELMDENRDTVQANLKAFEAELRGKLGSDGIKVDSIHDLARIIKVTGTVSHKGDPTPERPHRVSRPLDPVERVEDDALAARLIVPVPEATATPKSREDVPTFVPIARAARTREGEYQWASPVDMCSPIQRLWEQGYNEDRSLAIFNMVMFFLHKGLGLNEITDLVLEYDRRGLGKLAGRDGPTYIRNCYNKIAASVREDGTIAPPCHSLQRLGFCPVNREPGARCEIYDFIFDIERAVEAIPANTSVAELEYRLKPVLEAIAYRDPSMHGRYIQLIAKRFRLKVKDLRKAVDQAIRVPEESKTSDSKKDDDVFEGEIYEDTCFYYVPIGRDKTRIISSFAITPTMRVETDDGEIIIGRAHTDQGKVIEGLRLPLKAFHSKKDLMRHLPSADLQWTGSDNNTQGLMRVLARYPVPQYPSTTMIGDYRDDNNHLWICPDGAINKEGFLQPSPVIYLPTGGSLDGRVQYRQTDDVTFQAVANTVFAFLSQVNLPHVVIPILGWFFASTVKPWFMARVGAFPVLFIWGTQGSGKSSLIIDVFWPLFGLRDADPYSATETEFALLKTLSASRSVPVFIDEYRPYDMPRRRLNTLHRYIRRLYRGEVEERGRPDQIVNTYHLQTPLCVAGETRPVEAALLERLVTASMEKVTLDEHPEYQRAYAELKAVDLSLFAPRYIQFCLGRDFDTDLETAREVTRALVGDRKIPLRVAENLTAVLLGVHLFEQFADACGYSSLPVDLGARLGVEAMLDDLLETDHGVKNALDHFVEMLGVMAIQGELRSGVHHIIKGDILFLHLETAYDSFRKHCKHIDYQGEVVDLKALRRMIRENRRQAGYVVAESERVYFGGSDKRRRAMGIDPSKTDLVSADDFM